MKTIKLYGNLKKICGISEFKCDATRAGHILSFLKANYPQCEPHLAEMFYCIYLDDTEITFSNMNIPDNVVLKVIPLITGNWFFLSGLFTFLGSWVTGASITTALLYGAAAMGLSFLAELLAPVPIEPATDPQVESFLSNNTVNTTKAGGAAPLVFGECLVGSIVISAGSDVVDVIDAA